MPFKSDKQRRWMYANEPEMAERWSAEEKKKKKKKGLERSAKDRAVEMVKA
ncbi:MAG: hypothetical protein Unbinned4336contig1001_9 [Prokaryotic dsDNA virus sp.]|nr:MAG: hypothetical protein Unbinned4336contig1001_9 [Prokaryotic dsDNA virus sp.]|tara:strand:- start:2659 stop:2811 length:153 start_codon:yes stop_codon:yes gene_type:complete